MCARLVRILYGTAYWTCNLAPHLSTCHPFLGDVGIHEVSISRSALYRGPYIRELHGGGVTHLKISKYVQLKHESPEPTAKVAASPRCDTAYLDRGPARLRRCAILLWPAGVKTLRKKRYVAIRHSALYRADP